MFRGTSEHQQPQTSITHVSVPLPYPTTRATFGAIQTATDALVASMHEKKLDNDTAEPMKISKQDHAMDIEDHPKLTISTQEVNIEDTASPHTHTHSLWGSR